MAARASESRAQGWWRPGPGPGGHGRPGGVSGHRRPHAARAGSL